MTRRIFTACLTVLVAFAPLSAQTSGRQAAPALPKTPAGDELRAWLDAYNDGDSARIASYIRVHQPAQILRDAFGFRTLTGGFDLLTIERSEPRHIEFTVRNRRDAMVGYGALDVSMGEPPRATDLVLQPLGEDASVAGLRIGAPDRARIVKRTAALLDTFYVDSSVARRAGDTLRARLKRGAYDAYENGAGLALRLDRDLADIVRDRHLKLLYSPRPITQGQLGGAGPPAPAAAEIEREQRELQERNCGFRRAEHLDGNVGYIKFDMFANAQPCRATVAAAMNFVAGTRALILDLRENGGGRPDMVVLVASHLFERRTHLNDRWTRSTGAKEEFWTLDSVPGRRFGGAKPVYVLTSSHTFSAAEEFAYDLQALRRATVVGEVTGGGAHPTQMRRIDDHFLIGMPYAKAINPITRTNWEGSGVQPDVVVPAARGLDTVIVLLKNAQR
jgi:hypothetical protein